jgi:hypothetical protein
MPRKPSVVEMKDEKVEDLFASGTAEVRSWFKLASPSSLLGCDREKNLRHQTAVHSLDDQ